MKIKNSSTQFMGQIWGMKKYRLGNLDTTSLRYLFN